MIKYYRKLLFCLSSSEGSNGRGRGKGGSARRASLIARRLSLVAYRSSHITCRLSLVAYRSSLIGRRLSLVTSLISLLISHFSISNLGYRLSPAALSLLTYLSGVVVRHEHLARRVEPVVDHLPKRQIRYLDTVATFTNDTHE